MLRFLWSVSHALSGYQENLEMLKRIYSEALYFA